MVIDYFKRMSVVFCALVVMSLAYTVPAYARTATPSNAVRDFDDDIDSLDALENIDFASPSDASRSEFDFDRVVENAESFEYLEDDMVLRYILSEVQLIRDSMSGPLVASSSEAVPMEDAPDNEEDVTILSLSVDDAGFYASDISLPTHDVVWVSGTFDGSPYTLVVPADTYPYLYVGENRVLYNVSGSNITCRLFPSSTFDPTDYNYRNLTLYPILGNSASNLYRYDYLSYMTYYYRGSSSTSLSSSTTYGNFYVEDIEIQRSLDVSYRTYYIAVSSLFALGVIILCFWKSSRRL
ncbi:MAG: hypothetical protein LUK37_24800 [Clostridia bacterium]|nr:hypothetical protein [Clostridia bacterium]